MSILKHIFDLLLSLLSTKKSPEINDRLEDRSDFIEIRDSWKDYSTMLEARLEVLEARTTALEHELDLCRKEHLRKDQEMWELKWKVSQLDKKFNESNLN